MSVVNNNSILQTTIIRVQNDRCLNSKIHQEHQRRDTNSFLSPSVVMLHEPNTHKHNQPMRQSVLKQIPKTTQNQTQTKNKHQGNKEQPKEKQHQPHDNSVQTFIRRIRFKVSRRKITRWNWMQQRNQHNPKSTKATAKHQLVKFAKRRQNDADAREEHKTNNWLEYSFFCKINTKNHLVD